MVLGYGVMVTLQILVLSFQVRILVAQQKAERSNRAEQLSSALFFVLSYGKNSEIKELILRVFC